MDIIFIIFVIYYIWKIANQKSVKTLLYEVCNFQKLSNIEEIESEDDVVYIRADGRGANFLFVVKEISIDVTQSLINKILDKAQKLHIHNIIFVTSKFFDATTLYLLKQNNIKVWDKSALNCFLKQNYNIENEITKRSNATILSTSDTSDDKCKIDTNTYNPIQEGDHKVGSIFSGLFDKPDRL